ncbi:MAG: sodium:solute symporter family protein [Myxococcota bacterium]
MDTGVFWAAAVAMGVNYALVLGVGMLAARASPRVEGEAQVEDLMLAGRGLPLWVGVLTTTATWVGGGYVNGTAEQAWSKGMLWGVQAGVGYALSLVIGGLLFAPAMRRHQFWTLVDPLEQRYGRSMAAVLLVPAVLSELVWSAAVLLALGTTFGTVVGIDVRLAVVASASVAVAYTAFGGLRAVAWTDVVQLALLVVGLGIAVPYAVAWSGGMPAMVAHADGTSFTGLHDAISWWDWTILLTLGGIPWNCYFQRVLASPSERVAVQMSVGAGVLCALLVVPPLFLGLSARSFGWTEAQQADLVATPALVLPYLLRYAMPWWVSVVGLGAVTAAVMSSVDSSILSASSMLTWNLYRRLLHPAADPARIEKVVKLLVLVLGAVATLTALTVGSVAALWYLCGDIVYVALFPQLTLAMFDRRANRTGAFVGLVVALVLRLGGGEPVLGLPAFLPYPEWADGGFPFRTLAMVASLGTAWAVSRLTAAIDPPRPLDRLV